MSQAAGAADIEGMPHSKPFAWLLAAGMLCSLAGLAVAPLRGASSAVRPDPAPHISAFDALTYGLSNALPTVVTEASPASAAAGTASATAAQSPVPEAATAIAHVAATPTAGVAPAPMEAAPASAVQALPANVEHPTEAVRAPEKAWALFEAMNEARRAAGLAALEWDASLVEVAYARAGNLIEYGYFEHYGPDGESAFSELAARGIRYRLAGENLARNNYTETKTVAAAFEGLMASPGHRANILEERFSSVGVACVRAGRMWVYVTVFLN